MQHEDFPSLPSDMASAREYLSITPEETHGNSFLLQFFSKISRYVKKEDTFEILFLDSSSHDILRQAAVNSSDASVPWLGQNVDSFFAWVMNGHNMYCIYRS